jgi:hypothetical protein
VVGAPGSPVTIEAGINPEPFTVRVKAGPPATAEVGLMEEIDGVAARMGKLTELDEPGFETLIWETPSVASNSTGTVAVNWEELTKVVLSGVRTHRTVDAWANRSPVTVRVKDGPPASTDEGLRLNIVVPYGSAPTTSLMLFEAAVPGFFT